LNKAACSEFMKKKIALLPGDGIGPEVVNEAVKCLEAIANRFQHQFEFTNAPVGAIAIDRTGEPLPESTLQVCRESDAILFGAIGDPKYDDDPSATVRPEQGLLRLRKEMQLFTNIRPVEAYPELIDQSPLKNDRIAGTDFIIYRELTGGIYFGEKWLSEDKESASDLCLYTADEIRRIGHLAFQAAEKRRKKLTLVDKANVLESSRLWRRTITELAKTYPEVQLDFLFVDNAAMQIVLNPSQFDVVLTENMFGDILSDEGSVIAGSIGLLASASVGDQTALFEPIHGSFPQAKGLNIANPVASILSAAMLLDHFNLTEEAQVVRQAVSQSLKQGVVTSDLKSGSPFGTSEVGDFIADFAGDDSASDKLNDENIGLGKSTII